MSSRTVTSKRLRPLPLPIRTYNAIGSLTKPFGHPREIDSTNLMTRAQATTGLQDYGSKDFVAPLEKLVEGLNSEARLHPFGHFVAQKRLINLLSNRLRAVHWWTKHPEILAESVPPPVLIAGMQRTGTTLLHRLLSLDDRLRSLKSWEALNPAPFLSKDPQRRIKEAATSEKALKYLAPDFFAIHPVQHLSPEEDILLLDISLRSTVAEATMHVPCFSEWLQQQDQRPAYQFMKELLKLLQWSGTTGRWILKSPHHLEWLHTVDAVFPGTQYLQTHRHPNEIVPSLCSMIYHSRVLFSDHNHPREVGRHWINKMELMLSRCLDFRQRADGRFLDIDYRTFIKDPLRTMHSVYDFLELPLGSNHIKDMKQLLAAHGQHKFGKHQYKLADFTSEDIMKRPIFREYVATFNL